MRVMMTGHRPHLLTREEQVWAQERIQAVAQRLRDRYGMEEAISGMALGPDLWWAAAAVALGVPLHACIPFEEQASRWGEADRETWRRLRRAATSEEVTSTIPGARALHARNDAMLARATLVVAVHLPRITTGGTASTVKKARRRGLPIITIDPEARSVTTPRRLPPTR